MCAQKCRLDLPLLESSRKTADKSLSFKITESDGLEHGSADMCSALKKNMRPFNTSIYQNLPTLDIIPWNFLSLKDNFLKKKK